MLKNYLKVAVRIIFRHKGYSLINIFGLAAGMACCILILLLVQDELQFDKFHKNGEDLCLVGMRGSFGDQITTGATTAPAVGPALAEEYPEIIRSTRFNMTSILALRYEDKIFRERGHAADPDFLEMFTFPLVSGNPQTALTEPHSIVLTEELAEKYFADENPLGQTMVIDGQYAYKVTGIIKAAPNNSSIQFDFLIPFTDLEELRHDPGFPTHWYNWSVTTYIQLQPGASYKEVSAKIEDRLRRANPDNNPSLFLQPCTKLRLHGLSNFGGTFGMVIMFSILALFVLAIACINFMNLATARSANRAREIGMRKVAGASKRNIIFQFYGESFFMVLLSLAIALVLVELLLPVFNDLLSKQLTFNLIENPVFGLGLLCVVLITGLVAGFYPAIFMSLFQPAKIIKGGLGADSRNSRFRRTLVVMQFTLSVVLIIITTIIYRQVNFMQQADIGFQKEHLVYFSIKEGIRDHYTTVKQRLLQDPGVLQVSMTSRNPIGVYHNGSNWEWEGRDPAVNPLVTYYFTDVDFLETFGIKMAAGSFYAKESAGESSASSGEIVINETLARIIGADNPIGMRLSKGDVEYRIIGVLEDFHFKPLYQDIGPLIVFQKTNKGNPEGTQFNFVFARIRPDDPAATVAHIKDVYQEFSPDYPLELRFFDEVYDRLYQGVQRIGQIIEFSAGLAILISCLGLFGLAAFTAEQRTREIGVRKVLGATVPGIVRLLAKDFLLCVAIANAIGWPAGYLLMTGWMQDFAVRASIGWTPFAIAAGISLAVALLSVSYQAIKAATANPVTALRYE